MKEVVANTEDAAVEKHVPYTAIEEDDVLYVKVGEVDHPMTEEHYITWVAAVYDDSVLKYTFKPGEVPEAVFDYEEGMVVYAYCNLHGLWKKEL
jgi:superoxide reductase